MKWVDFARAVPDFAAAGKRLLTPSGGVSIGFLATIGDSLHLAPVCPIFSDAGVYLSIGASTPKRADLERDGRYVLHAFLAANDEEFRIGGRAAYVAAEAERLACMRRSASAHSIAPIRFLCSISKNRCGAIGKTRAVLARGRYAVCGGTVRSSRAVRRHQCVERRQIDVRSAHDDADALAAQFGR